MDASLRTRLINFLSNCLRNSGDDDMWVRMPPLTKQEVRLILHDMQAQQ